MDSSVSSQILNAGGYGSEFESDAEDKKRRKDIQNLLPVRKRGTGGVAKKRELEDEYNKEEGRITRIQVLSMDAYGRHQKYVNDYLQYYGGTRSEFKRDTSNDKTDHDIIRENHRFLWTEDDETDSWERNLAKKYYDKLFKEYCIADLSRYKENKVGMRWRIEKEVIDGKGQFECGNKKCRSKEVLKSWEVNFGYIENGEKKNALIKLRLCPDCSYKLNYHHKKREVTKKKKTQTSKRQKTSSESIDEAAEGSTNVDPAMKESSEKTDQTAWKGPIKETEVKSREEEFDDYFEDMFL